MATVGTAKRKSMKAKAATLDEPVVADAPAPEPPPSAEPPPKEHPPPQSDQAHSWLERLASGLFPGVFFIALGLGVLIWSRAELGEVHSAFTFVQIVLGTAVFLYGTGTTGTGSAELGSYRLAIAGGAGVLAFAIGAAMAFKAGEMKDVFREQNGFAKVKFSLLWDGRKARSGEFVAIVGRQDGVTLPTLMTEQQVSVLVPVTLSGLAQDRDVTIEFDVVPNRSLFQSEDVAMRIECKVKLGLNTFPAAALAEGVLNYDLTTLPTDTVKSMSDCVDADTKLLKLSLRSPASANQRLANARDTLMVDPSLVDVGAVPQ